MKTEQKREIIKQYVTEMLQDSHEAMVKKLEKVLDSGAIDIDGWDEASNRMILPKCIVTALIESEAHQYAGIGTSFEKQVKKEVENIRRFI